MRSLPDGRSARGGGVAYYGRGRREDGISFGVFWEAWRCPSFSHTLDYGGRHGHEAPKDRAASEDMDLLVARGGGRLLAAACGECVGCDELHLERGGPPRRLQLAEWGQ